MDTKALDLEGLIRSALYKAGLSSEYKVEVKTLHYGELPTITVRPNITK